MKKIHVITTNDGRILTVACASDIPGLLAGASVEGEWFIDKPDQLDEFLETNTEQLKIFLKVFSNWIEFRVKGSAENKELYTEFKKKMETFSETLFEKVRKLAKMIAKLIKEFLHPKEDQYKEERLQKKVYRQSTSGPIGQITL